MCHCVLMNILADSMVDRAQLRHARAAGPLKAQCQHAGGHVHTLNRVRALFCVGASVRALFCVGASGRALFCVGASVVWAGFLLPRVRSGDCGRRVAIRRGRVS